MPRKPRTGLSRSEAATRRHEERRKLTRPNSAPYPLEPMLRRSRVIHSSGSPDEPVEMDHGRPA